MSGEVLAPIAGKARIDVLDIMRGIAILGIFYMNIPFQSASVVQQFADIRLLGWTPADQIAWAGITIYWEGTQRCLLEFLFGAGMMILTARAMTPDGPVAVADLYLRRNIWLIAFGLFDIFVILWVGDILFIYGVAALFLLPFRRLSPRLLVALGCIFALFYAAEGGARYAERSALAERVAVAQAHRAASAPLTPADTKALADWGKASYKPVLDAETTKRIAEEKVAHGGSPLGYARYYWSAWFEFFWAGGQFALSVAEAFCAMLIGVALWKWGVIQGQRSTRFYAVLTLAAYGFGLGARAIGVGEAFAFDPAPKTIWITGEFARLAVGLGHLGLIHLAVRTRLGWTLLAPFRAAGRTAFSLYFFQQIIGIHILFSPYGLNLWGRYGWAQQFWIATVMFFALLLLANLWTRYFAMGPLEWLWRSLSYLKAQPFRRPRAAAAGGEGAAAQPA